MEELGDTQATGGGKELWGVVRVPQRSWRVWRESLRRYKETHGGTGVYQGPGGGGSYHSFIEKVGGTREC